MSKLEKISAFVEVMDQQSFTSAAKSFGISTAAMSKKILSLEKELGIQLIRRTTRKVELTESGQIYFDHCKYLIEGMKEAEKLVSHLKGEPSGILRVTAAPYFAEKYIIPKLCKFLALYPQLRMDLEMVERMPDIFKERIDILFGYSMTGPAQSVQKKIFSTRYVFCGSPQYLKDFGIPKEPKDLLRHRYINHSMRKPELVSSKTQVHLTPYLKLNDTQAMLNCCLDGIGIVKLHHYVAEEALRQKKLIEVLEKYSKEEVAVFLYYQPSKYLQPKVRKFIDFFVLD